MFRVTKRTRLVCALFTIAVVMQRASISAAQGGPGEAEQTAIRTAAAAYLEAKRQGDADAMRAFWTADGDYVDAAGRLQKAHDSIGQQSSAERRESPAPAGEASLSTLRFITPDIALEDGTIEFGTAEDGTALTGRFTAVWVKRDGRWLLDSLRESVQPIASPNSRLQPLAWLLGEWTATSDDAVFLVSSRWSDGGRYIVREFLVRNSSGETVVGSQRIGWDPVEEKIRSWTFDSQGSRGEGEWRADGDRWVVVSSDVMADGTRAETSSIYVPGEDGVFVWEVNSASVAGVDVPKTRIVFRRAAAD